MISRNLDPIDLGFGISYEEAAQAMAFSYLAQSNTEDVLTRVDTAYRRAWGNDRLIRFPRKDNGTPGFMVAIWDSNRHRRMLIAIEGSTSGSQIVNLSTATGWTSRTGIGGYVMSNFKTKADDIYAQILANSITSNRFSDPRTIFTWAGHSLGAACADINAIRHKTENPAEHVRLIKFGAPCVGNSVYVATTATLVPRANFYVNRDPIWMVPSAEVRNLSIALSALDSGPIPDALCTRLNYLSSRVDIGYYEYPYSYTRLHLAVDAAREINLDNPFWDHMPSAYRFAFMVLFAKDRDLSFYRFNFLEHNFENRWQTHPLHETGNFWSWDAVDTTLIGFEQDPPTAQIDEAVYRARAGVPIPGGGDGPDGGGGGDYGEASIPPPALNNERVPFMQPIAGPVADFGVPIPASNGDELRGRRIRHVIP